MAIANDAPPARTVFDASLVPRLLAFDCETGLITDQNATPVLVCSAIARVGADGKYESELLDRDQTIELMWTVLQDPNIYLVTAYGAYDFGVVANEDIRLLPLIFEAYEQGRILDIQLTVALDAIGRGHLGKNPDGSVFPHEPGKEYYSDGPKAGQKRPVPNHYSLWQCVRLVLGRTDAKENDKYKLAYEGLLKLPMAEWPEEAIQYPQDDAINTLEVLVELLLREGDNAPLNIHDTPTQSCASFALALASMVGLHVNPEATQALRASIDERNQRGLERFVASGILRPDGSKDTKAMKRKLLIAMAAPECPFGTEPPEQQYSPKTGKPLKMKPHDPHAKCEKCDKTGYLIPDGAEMTATGALSMGREVLRACTDVDLEAWAEYSEDERVATTYLPWLETALENVVPSLHPRANTLLDTGRVSYQGPAQLLPANKDANSDLARAVRPCLRAGPGRVLVSIDFGQQEILCQAQTSLWVLGASKLAEAVNAGRDVHCDLAADILQKPYEEVLAGHKAEDPFIKTYRDIAKIGNFGFLGGMGETTFVVNQRAKKVIVCKLFGHTECEMVPRASLPNQEGKPGRICIKCLRIVKEVRPVWYSKWDMGPFFEWVSEVNDNVGAMASFVPLGYGLPVEGMKCDIDRVRGGVTYTVAANTCFQPLAARATKIALWTTTRACYEQRESCLIGASPVLAVHDELLFSVLEDRCEDAAESLRLKMEASQKRVTPDLARGVKSKAVIMREGWVK
jgi:hypothetical protein